MINKDKISKNCYKASQIKTVDELFLLADDKRSVYCENWGIKPAAVLINMPCFVIIRQIRNGNLYRIFNLSEFGIKGSVKIK